MSLGGAHPSPTAEVCGVGRRQGSFCPPPRASPRGSFGSVTSQGCGVPPQQGCGTQGRGREDLTRGVGAKLQLGAPLGAAGRAAGPALAGCLQGAEMLAVGGLASSPAKPHRLPPETPRGAPITAAQCPCGMMGMALLTLPAKQRMAFGVPGDPSVPDAPLATGRAEKNIGGLWTCVHPLSIG